MKVTFAEDHVCFEWYPFRGATVYRAGAVPIARIRDADWHAIRPELRTRRGETLFVPREQSGELAEFCHRTGIPEVRRADVWADLLEPFLDTEFGAEAERATLGRLHAAGLPSAEVARIRARITPLMEAYNFDSMLWEWAYFGLYDLLQAVNGPLVAPAVRATAGDPAEVYAWAMRIADDACIVRRPPAD
ncbi:hypothetical protein [Amycolatopsis nalaikhensis]|uniref:Cytochrome P450 n=1 Tax=Amycolatopsis nalaikhensis TaxID=715472 RepID=A0ABY8XJK6_9PSEU|nr:hypothetical protein [Amycolatopsis sp. 2-2]WIV55806.1 hypothetical protein QP939_44545 [Amycolatopsis sp. 2-2]